MLFIFLVKLSENLPKFSANFQKIATILPIKLSKLYIIPDSIAIFQTKPQILPFSPTTVKSYCTATSHSRVNCVSYLTASLFAQKKKP